MWGLPTIEGATCGRCGGPVHFDRKLLKADAMWGKFRCERCGILDEDFMPFKSETPEGRQKLTEEVRRSGGDDDDDIPF